MFVLLHCQTRFKDPAEEKHLVVVSAEAVTASWHHFTTSRPGVGLLSCSTWMMSYSNRLWLCLTAWCRGWLLVPWCSVGWCPTSPSTETSAGPRTQRGSPPMCAWFSWWQTSWGYSSGDELFPLCCTVTKLHLEITQFNTLLHKSQIGYIMKQVMRCSVISRIFFEIRL